MFILLFLEFRWWWKWDEWVEFLGSHIVSAVFRSNLIKQVKLFFSMNLVFYAPWRSTYWFKKNIFSSFSFSTFMFGLFILHLLNEKKGHCHKTLFVSHFFFRLFFPAPRRIFKCPVISGEPEYCHFEGNG